MPSIHDTPPAAIQNDLNNLAQALHTRIPAKTDTNLLIATWNIRRFVSLTRKWTAGDNDSPKRDLRSLAASCKAKLFECLFSLFYNYIHGMTAYEETHNTT